jgi:hypothetical protein
MQLQAKIKIGQDVENLLKRHEHLVAESIEQGMTYIAIHAPKSVKKRIVELGLSRSGNLAKSIQGHVEKGVKTIVGSYAHYAHMLEGGAKAHTIKLKPTKKKALSWAGAEHPMKSLTIKHPGIKAYKFLEGGIEEMSESGELESLFSRGVKEVMERYGGS